MFRAIVVKKTTGDTGTESTEVGIRDVDDDFLGDGDVTIDVTHSSINFKDGMFLAGKRGIGKTSPLIPGIDLVGTVASSDSDRFAVGDRRAVRLPPLVGCGGHHRPRAVRRAGQVTAAQALGRRQSTR